MATVKSESIELLSQLSGVPYATTAKVMKSMQQAIFILAQHDKKFRIPAVCDFIPQTFFFNELHIALMNKTYPPRNKTSIKIKPSKPLKLWAITENNPEIKAPKRKHHFAKTKKPKIEAPQ